MSDENAIKRQLKIKTGVVKRMTKEKGYYEKEGIKLRENVKKLEEKQAGGEEVESWTMKNSNNLVGESDRTMVKFLGLYRDHVEDLRELVSKLESDERFSGDETFADAKKALDDVGSLEEEASA